MIKRLLDLKKLLKEKHSTFLFGPRGVGKTLLCQKFLSGISHKYHIDLLNYELYMRYLTHPNIFRKEVEKKIEDNKILTVFIDEVQKIPPLLDEVHYLIEKFKGQVRFILTGSSARKLKRGGANLLAGRAWNLKLHPLSHLELNIDISKALTIGTLPAVYLEEDSPERTLKAYVETYLKEEILQEALVRKVEGFFRFLDLAGQMNGEPVNFTTISKACGVSIKTVQEFFSILVDTLIVFQINAWTFSIKKQITKASKYYFFDCGVLNAITGELKTELRESTFRYGKLFETFIIQEIIRINDYIETDYRFFYWRTNTGLEVDIILSKGLNSDLIAIEIKSDSTPEEKDFRGLKSFKSENSNAKLYCLCKTEATYQIGEITVFPWREGIKEVFKT